MTDWLAPIDLYCERTAEGLLNEPVNAASNLAFVVAALVAGRAARRRGPVPVWLGVMLCLGGGIGVGSFLFHVAANEWSHLADIVPIWSFVACHVYCMVRLMGGHDPRPGHLTLACLGTCVLLGGATVLGGEPDGGAAARVDPFNGSLSYLPAVAALVLFSVVAAVRRDPLRRPLFAATALFAIALGFRTIDLRVCAAWPVGTHFLWHLGNGLLVGLLLHMLTLQVPAAAERSRR